MNKQLWIDFGGASAFSDDDIVDLSLLINAAREQKFWCGLVGAGNQSELVHALHAAGVSKPDELFAATTSNHADFELKVVTDPAQAAGRISFGPNVSLSFFYSLEGTQSAEEHSKWQIPAFCTLIPLLKLNAKDGLFRLMQIAGLAELVLDINQSQKEIHEEFAKRKQLYIFAALRNGAKVLSQAELAGYEVLGFIDNAKEKKGGSFLNKPIFGLDEISDTSVPIVVSSGRHGVPIRNQLTAAGFNNQLSFMAWLFFVDAQYQAEPDFRSYLSDLFDNRKEYILLYLRLADDKSRRVLNHLIMLRLSLDAEHALLASDPVHTEYFDEDIIALKSDEVFVDGGAYDGDTAQRFVEAVGGKYQSMHLFEPDQDIYARLEARATEFANAHAYQLGLFDEEKVLTFSNTGEMNSALSENGTISVKVLPLDQLLSAEPVSFIKLDVEGAERAALEGASHIIQVNQPKMTMGAYHRAHDLWSLANSIDRIYPDYKFYLRHYSQIIDDTALYAIYAGPNLSIKSADETSKSL